LETRKIVSYLPSATEILYELGVGSQIKGVTHECDYPKDSKSKPKVIKPLFDTSAMTSREINDKIIESSTKNNTNFYILNEELLKEVKPDLIIAQGICGICSPSRTELEQTIKLLGCNPQILILDPHNLNDILTNIIEISEKISKIDQGKQLIKTLQEKISSINNKIPKVSNSSKSKILCLEWLDPFFTADHWVPQMIEIAGGLNLISKTGERSRIITIEEIKNSDPDKIILMPCGFGVKRTLKEYNKILKKEVNWNLLKAVNNKEVYIVDSGSYFSKPGPRTFIGIEILAKIINPIDFEHIIVPSQSFLKVK